MHYPNGGNTAARVDALEGDLLVQDHFFAIYAAVHLDDIPGACRV
ncbi:MAG: hypothetical protein A4E48_01519 [Methanosaeta sp. PtaU1.Bin060]|nr:MAG: hypothetical protein A4E48_01519 [Methanosaeta sp. PtaU1.Bin060]